MNDRKANSLIAHMQNDLVVWIEDQARHNTPLGQYLIQSQALTLLNSRKTERGEEAAEENSEVGRGWLMMLVKKKKRQQLSLAKIIHEYCYSKQQIVSVYAAVAIGRGCHLGLFVAGEEKSVPGFKGQADSLFRG